MAGGYVSYFQGPRSCGIQPAAAIYWSASTGGNAVWGDNYKEYTLWGVPLTVQLGFPVSDPVPGGGGLANYFGTGGPGPYGNKAAIYWSAATGAHAIWGDDYRDYLSHSGSLGLPLSDPQFSLPGDPAYFVGPPSCTARGSTDIPQNNCGAIYWSSATGAHALGATPILSISIIRMRSAFPPATQTFPCLGTPPRSRMV